VKYLYLLLFSLSAHAASILDASIHSFQQINESRKVLDMCAKERSVNNCSLKTEPDQEVLNKYKQCNNHKYNQEVFGQFLSEDQTSEFTYVLDAKSPDWFVCQHFSTQSFMRGSCFANHEFSPEYEKSTNIKIQNEDSKLQNQQPIFYVSIASPSNNFYHAINAVFIGDSVEEMKDLNNFILYEPQSDKLYYTIKDFRADWEKYNFTYC
jgi:hypothetical protein